MNPVAQLQQVAPVLVQEVRPDGIVLDDAHLTGVHALERRDLLGGRARGANSGQEDQQIPGCASPRRHLFIPLPAPQGGRPTVSVTMESEGSQTA